jgi:hypothetical protein
MFYHIHVDHRIYSLLKKYVKLSVVAAGVSRIEKYKKKKILNGGFEIGKGIWAGGVPSFCLPGAGAASFCLPVAGSGAWKLCRSKAVEKYVSLDVLYSKNWHKVNSYCFWKMGILDFRFWLIFRTP